MQAQCLFEDKPRLRRWMELGAYIYTPVDLRRGWKLHHAGDCKKPEDFWIYGEEKTPLREYELEGTLVGRQHSICNLKNTHTDCKYNITIHLLFKAQMLTASIIRSMTMDAISPLETSVYFYQTTRRNFPEDSRLLIRHRANLKSHLIRYDSSEFSKYPGEM
jgi:hypothetical protein